MLTIGECFAGISGFGLGFEQAGAKVVWQIENDKACLSVLDKHFPNTKKYGDIRNVTNESLEHVDVICGGFPCQDVSVAGRRKGLDGERSGLYFEFQRIITSVHPRWVVVENVPGLLSSNEGRDFAIVLGGLTGIIPEVPETGWRNSGFAKGKQGFYNIAWRVLDSRYFGVAQRRRRVFIVGNFVGMGRSVGNSKLRNPRGLSGVVAKVLFESESGTRDFKASKKRGQGFAPVAGTLSANRGGTERPAGNANELDFVIPVSFKKRGGFGWSMNNNLSGTLESESGTHQGGPERIPLVLENDFDNKTFVVAVDIRNLKEQPSGITGTLQSKKTGGYSLNYHPSILESGFGVRRLTPVECERLQAFLDDYTSGQSDSNRYKQLGNAVTVNVIRWIAKRIVGIENEVIS